MLAGVLGWLRRYRALGYAAMGIRLTLSPAGTKNFCMKKSWQRFTRDVEEGHVYDQSQDNAVAIVTGDASDLLVVDGDFLKAGEEDKGILCGVQLLQKLTDQHGLEEGVPKANSASGGLHLFFSLSKSLAAGLTSATNRAKVQYAGHAYSIDVRADGGCIVVAPSAHSNGGYTWLTPLPNKEELQAAPAWLIEVLNHEALHTVLGVQQHKTALASRKRALEAPEYVSLVRPKIEGLISTPMASVWVRDGGFDFKPLDRARHCITCGGTHTSNNYCVRQLLDSCFVMRNYSTTCKQSVFGWEDVPVFGKLLAYPDKDDPWVELLRAFQTMHGRTMAFVEDGKERFLCFNGVCWEPVSKREVALDVKVIGQTIIAKLLALLPKEKANDEMRKALGQARSYVMKAHNINSIVESARVLLFDKDLAAKLDTVLDILPAPNGVIELRTGLLRPGRPDDYASTFVPVEYRGLEHPTPQVDTFFADIFNGDAPLIAYMQRLLGYAITGEMREQIWVIWTGSGSNGKGLLLEMLEAVLGEVYFKNAKREVFFKADRGRAAGAAEPHLVALRGARIAAKDEGDASAPLDSEGLKGVTGQSKMTVRDNYAGYMSFTPTHLPLLLCNQLPRINVEDPAELRRIVPFYFENVYTTPTDTVRPFDPADPTHRLRDDGKRDEMTSTPVLEQFLVWLVRGAVAWYAGGLGQKPAAVEKCLREYIENNDGLQDFIAEKMTVAQGLSVNAKDFRAAYNQQAAVKVSRAHLIPMMKKRGFAFVTTGSVFSGLDWRSQ